jgi:hypothetical protein
VTSVQNVRAGQPTPVTAPARVATARRVRAAMVLAGDPPPRRVASAAGLGYPHLVGVIKGAEPLLASDAVDLARVLGCPASWLAHGWDEADR